MLVVSGILSIVHVFRATAACEARMPYHLILLASVWPAMHQLDHIVEDGESSRLLSGHSRKHWLFLD